MKKLLIGFAFGIVVLACLAPTTNTNTLISWTGSSLNNTQFTTGLIPLSLTNISALLGAGSNVNSITQTGSVSYIQMQGGLTTNIQLIVLGNAGVAQRTNEFRFTNGLLKSVLAYP